MPLPPIVTHRGERLDPLVIHQPDYRRTYNDPDTYPWRCVCRITRPDGRRGSGVLIGKRHVLTASHVVQWNTNVAERIEVHFAGNSPQATAFTKTAYAYTQIPGPGVPSSEIDEDYAVMTLTERLGERFGFFGTKLYDSSWDDDPVWDTIGYAFDIAQSNFPMFQLNVSLDETDLGSARNMTTSADAMPIQSGSPMFGRWTGDPIAYAVAVVSASDGVDNWCAGGEDLNGIVRHARTQDP
ncbi:MAG: trypsin-like serine peptidase [Beijerinckiaceae bacterium]